MHSSLQTLVVDALMHSCWFKVVFFIELHLSLSLAHALSLFLSHFSFSLSYSLVVKLHVHITLSQYALVCNSCHGPNKTDFRST